MTWRYTSRKNSAALNLASRSNDITDWVSYFVQTVLQAQVDVENHINFILKKSVYFDTFESQMNERQLKVIQRMVQAGLKGFEGGMSAKKYMAIIGTSKASATRDLQDLLVMGAVKQVGEGEGRGVRYDLNL